MSEIDINVLSLYDIDIEKQYKGRDSFMVQQGKQIYKLMHFSGSEGRVAFLNELTSKLKERGNSNTDIYIRNKEGNILTVSEASEKYILKTHIQGNECDVKNIKHILKSVEELARLHNEMNSLDISVEVPETQKIGVEYEKHLKELKKVKNYIRGRKKKTTFEYDILLKYNEFYELGETTLNTLMNTTYQELERSEMERGSICHGNYNYHNVIFDGDKVSIVNFEKAGLGLQIKDLYFYMRKIMEKYNWNTELGISILESYDKVKKISRVEHEILMLLLKFPEKFWKVVNQYYNGNKNWIPDKNLDKLHTIYVQQHRKEFFIEKMLNR